MSEPAPVVYFDFEFCFRSGQTLNVSAQGGRDEIAADEQRVRLELREDPSTVEEIIITRAELAYMRTLRRTVAPPVSVEDAGRLRIVGGA